MAEIRQIPQLVPDTSVNEMQEEMKKQHKKKIYFCIAMLALGFIIAAIVVYVGHEATNGFKFGTSGKSVTADMVLPNTTLEISKITNDKTFGNIYYYEADLTSKELGFAFLSLYNETHDLVSFVMMDDDINNVDTTYESLFNGVYGFEIDLTGDNRKSRGISSNESLTELSFTIYNFDNSIDTIKLYNNNETMSESNIELLTNLIIGKIGEYFVELSIKLGSNKYIGKDYRSVSYITSYARYFWSICNENETYCNWDKEILDEAVSLTNQIIDNENSNNNNNNNNNNKQNNTNTPFISKNDSVSELSDEKRRLQTSGCSATWYYLGDGYCDSSANNAACNWDNGDCCSHTCDSGVNWQDKDDTSYSGYSCGVVGYNCLPGCSVSNPSWLGDGYCDKTGGYNTAACNYDNGDCCQDTCKDGTYSCGANGYSCSDSAANYCSRSHCDNECFGLCGAGCDCWSWACGDCHCHGECSEHDSYCSCDSMWAFWCINVLWVNCDDGSVAVL